ncbi:MAG: hypothetical protein AB4426_03070, partial [Xenococcaceae cyanobacterium]
AHAYANGNRLSSRVSQAIRNRFWSLDAYRYLTTALAKRTQRSEYRYPKTAIATPRLRSLPQDCDVII